jgi:tetratricopeptide (TPR) repeat protein
LDVIKYYKEWLGFYPFRILCIIPGGRGRWGGYPFATGIVVIHGMETFKEGEDLYHWKHITAHEIGHEYWGEWVLDPDKPRWLWIGMGIFADTEYKLARKINPEARANWMGNYLNGLRMYYDTTVDVPPHWLSRIEYDRNNTVTHSKGFSIVSALDSVLGREMFIKIYKKCLQTYGGKRLGWKKLQSICEKESGQDLDWFFDQWVRSNTYLCYRIEWQESRPEGDGYLTTVQVKRLGTMSMPVPVKAVFEDGSEQKKTTDRSLEFSVLTFESRAPLKEVILNPENKLAMLKDPLAEIFDEAKELLGLGWSSEKSDKVYELIKNEKITNDSIWYNLGMYLYNGERFSEALDCFTKVSCLKEEGVYKFAALGWMGLLSDLLGEREKALRFYREALKYDTGKPVRHSWLRININREWVEERIKTPFSQETLVDIPSQPTAEQLTEIVDSLHWKWEGKTPLVIYEKAKDLSIENRSFWFKLGMLLFDSGYCTESFVSFVKVSKMEVAKLYKFSAYTWMGHLKDLMGEREEAVGYYQKALEYDTGDTMQHSQFRMRINRKWVEERLKRPFTWKKR